MVLVHFLGFVKGAIAIAIDLGTPKPGVRPAWSRTASRSRREHQPTSPKPIALLRSRRLRGWPRAGAKWVRVTAVSGRAKLTVATPGGYCAERTYVRIANNPGLTCESGGPWPGADPIDAIGLRERPRAVPFSGHPI